MLQTLSTTEQAKAYLCKLSFSHFVQQAWPYIESPSNPLIWSWALSAICDHLQAVYDGKITRLCINIPPRTAKSTIASVLFPLWVWLTRPDTRFLLLSYALRLAVRDNVRCRDLIRTQWFQDRWGDIVILKSDEDLKESYSTTAGGMRQTTSIGSSATGLGAGIIICDDANAADESNEVRQSTLEWWDATMPTRLDNPKTGAFISIQQRTAENDLTGHLLSKGGYTLLKLPMEYEGDDNETCIGFKDPRTIDGELLCPERFGPAEVEFLKKELGPFRSAGQLQQRPTSREGGLLNPNWFKYWTTATLPDTFDDSLISVDCTFKGTKDSDYVVFQAWGRVKAEYFLLDQVRSQMNFGRTVETLKLFCEKWRTIRTVIVEDKSNGPAVISTLRHTISGIIPFNPGRDSKESRLNAVSPMVESGNTFLPKDAPWLHLFLAEALNFPKGKHDDMIDCMSQALIRLDKTKRRSIVYGQHSVI